MNYQCYTRDLSSKNVVSASHLSYFIKSKFKRCSYCKAM